MVHRQEELLKTSEDESAGAQCGSHSKQKSPVPDIVAHDRLHYGGGRGVPAAVAQGHREFDRGHLQAARDGRCVTCGNLGGPGSVCITHSATPPGGRKNYPRLSQLEARQSAACAFTSFADGFPGSAAERGGVPLRAALPLANKPKRWPRNEHRKNRTAVRSGAPGDELLRRGITGRASLFHRGVSRYCPFRSLRGVP